MLHYTAIVTLLAIAFYFFLGTRVAAARSKHGVKHPAMTGNADFERVVRVHLNTLEWLPVFLVPLWLAAAYLNDIAAAALGVVWIGGRLWYYVGYSKSVEQRVPGFAVQALVCVVLFVGAVVGIVMRAV
jgi:glutathione S-transferase